MGNCEAITQTAVANAVRNKGLIFQRDPSLTRDQIWDQLMQIHNSHSKKDEKYYIFGIPVKKRVSEIAKRMFGLKYSSATSDQEVGREGGTYVHEIMAKLIDFHYNDVGTMKEIQDFAAKGKFEVKGDDFIQLNNLAVSLIEQIVEQQERIDPDGKAYIKPELFIVNTKDNVGGTIDLFALFSDGTSSIYDYKTRRPHDPEDGNIMTDSGLTLMHDLLSYSNTKSYDLAMQTYSDILTQENNVKAVRQNRLVPILVSYKYLAKDNYNKEIGKTLDTKINAILATEEESEFLAQLPVRSEASRFEGLNKLLEKQISEISVLQKKYKSKTLSQEEKEAVLERINRLEKAVGNIRLREDMTSVIEDMVSLLNEIRTTLKQDKFKGDNTENPLYPNLRNLIELKMHLTVYQNILDESSSFFEDLKKTNPKLYNNQYKRVRDLVGGISDMSLSLAKRIEAEVLKDMAKEHKTDKGSLKNIPELNWIDGRTLHFSEIDHPVFKEAWSLIQKGQYNTKVKFNELDKEAWGKTKELFTWALRNGMSNMDAFKLLIDENTGNMVSVLNKDFSRKMYKLFSDPFTEESGIEKRYEEVRKYYRFKNHDEWKEEYNEKLSNFKLKMLAKLNNLEIEFNEDGSVHKTKKELEREYNKAILDYEKKYNLDKYKSAWFYKEGKFSRKYRELLPEIAKQNYSEQYKRIDSNKPLKDYYDMWVSKMEEFYNILGITDYNQLPREFVPNIRKEIIEHFTANGFNIPNAIREFMDSFNVREEDTHIAQVDENGEVIKQIPILFLNPFIDKDGKLDLERKSFDLTSSLLLFGKMVYNYKNMNEVEPKIQAMKLLMSEPTSEQGATEVTDTLGRRIRGMVQPFLTRHGLDSDTYRLFESFTDLALYGTRFTEKSLSKKFNTTKALLTVKNYNALLKLGFAAIPALGAYVAGKTGIYFESKKDISYGEKEWANAQRLLITNPKKYAALVQFFDPYNDDSYERTFRGRSATAKRKLFSERLAFWPLRQADKKIMDHISVAMMQNYGVDKNGNIIRLNRAGVDASLYTPLIDAFVEDPVTGEVTINVNEDAFISFRNAIKKTSQGIIGNMNPEDISATNVSLTQNIMMQFKTWMPAVVREYTGKLRYDADIQSMRWGRFSALADQFGMYHLNSEDLDNGTKIALFAKKVLAPELGKLILDLATFGVLEKYHVAGYNRVNRAKAEIKFKAWLAENPEYIDKVTIEDFIEIKRGQLKASLTTIRVIFAFLGLIAFLRGSGDDDEPRYAKNWLTRTGYKVLTKAESEIAFMWTPGEFVRMLKNPFPMLQLLDQAGKTIENGADEFLDYIYGENSPQDKTKAGYYMIQWVPGGTQISRFAELFPQYKKSPYAPIKFR